MMIVIMEKGKDICYITRPKPELLLWSRTVGVVASLLLVTRYTVECNV